MAKPALYRTLHTYADRTLTQVVTTLNDVPGVPAMVTTVTDGPLHDCVEITTKNACPEALRVQHEKWLWRVVHAEQTHPEWFARKAKRTPQG